MNMGRGRQSCQRAVSGPRSVLLSVEIVQIEIVSPNRRVLSHITSHSPWIPCNASN